MNKPIQLKLPTGLPVGSVNAYLFIEPEPVLIDAGIKTESCWQALVDQLAAHKLTPADLSRIIITHPHVDHYGLARRLVENSPATVWINELGEPWLREDGARWQARLHFYRDNFLPSVGYPPEMVQVISQAMWQIWQQADPVPQERLVTFAPDAVLTFGGGEWQAIHVPGHTFAQTAFYQPSQKWLLSADHLLEKTPTPVVEQAYPQPKRLPSLPQFLQSLKLMAQLDVAAVFPGHGRPFTDHLAAINRQLARINQRKEEAFTLIEQGHTHILDILDIMYAHHPPQVRFAGLWMLVGYLDLLLADGRIVQKVMDGIVQYDIAPSRYHHQS